MSGMMTISGEEFERGKLIPYHGTIFTARLPQVYGGINSEISLEICDQPFGKYAGNTTLSNTQFGHPWLVRSMRAGDYGRFIVDDSLLQTGHSVSERNWFRARFLRPVLTSRGRIDRMGRVSKELRDILLPEGFSQRIVSPENTSLIIDSVLSRETEDLSTTSATLNNDLKFMDFLSRGSADVLQDFYDSIRQ